MGGKAQVSLYLKMYQEITMAVGLLVEHSSLSQLSRQHYTSNAPALVSPRPPGTEPCANTKLDSPCVEPSHIAL